MSLSSSSSDVSDTMHYSEANVDCNEADCSSHIFGRIKRPMIQRMAKAAGIRHVSTNLYDAIRSALHRYLKEQVAFALSHVDEFAQANAISNPVIPNKTFLHMVSRVYEGAKMSNGAKLSKPVIHALHAKTEAWWLELFQSVHMVSMHRGANVAQPSDLDVVQRLRRTC